ncbi:NAD-dependent epimerase/dehydratase family protein [Patescibacteria group bacterium]|nr:NAD-dependent epimerase/dehydratase family protein [Patescibacteria group bacterium]
MKVIVTGGAGFIGSHIVDKLIAKNYQVVVIDSLVTGKKGNLDSAAKFYETDIRDKKAVAKIFSIEKPDLVCHQAAHASVRESTADPQYDADVNILGSLSILQSCVQAKVKKIVFASTGGALYGDADQMPTPETYPTKPICPYGVAKLSVEQYLHYYHKIFKLPYVILRYANVYGPRQDPHGEAGVVAIFSQKMIAGEQPIINGNGEQTRDYVSVKDVVAANIKALESGFINETFNIGTGQETSVNKLFQTMVKIIGKPIKEKYGPAKTGEQKTSALSWDKIKQELNWQPTVDLPAGLAETINSFQ